MNPNAITWRHMLILAGVVLGIMIVWRLLLGAIAYVVVLRHYHASDSILDIKRSSARERALAGTAYSDRWGVRVAAIDAVRRQLADAATDPMTAFRLPRVKNLDELDDAIELLIQEYLQTNSPHPAVSEDSL